MILALAFLFLALVSTCFPVLFHQIVQRSRDAFSTGRTLPYEFRVKQLKNMLHMFEENENDLIGALEADLRKVG